MRPYEGSARCPECGRVDFTVVLEPLFVVTGASGSGKTAVFGPLARQLAGQCVTFDVDWLIDPATTLAVGQPLDWSALRDAWLAVAHGVAQAGMPTVLLGPLIPEHLDSLPLRQWVGDIHFLVLDCPDEIRRERIDARPVWRRRDIDEQTEFGRWLRQNISDRVDTSHGTPADSAHAVAGWVMELLRAC
jgi:hypothetical protein